MDTFTDLALYARDHVQAHHCETREARAWDAMADQLAADIRPVPGRRLALITARTNEEDSMITPRCRPNVALHGEQQGISIHCWEHSFQSGQNVPLLPVQKPHKRVKPRLLCRTCLGIRRPRS